MTVGKSFLRKHIGIVQCSLFNSCCSVAAYIRHVQSVKRGFLNTLVELSFL